MNKKFLLSTVAVASLLAACTQDEALEAPQAASQAQRPVAGVVEFTNPQTRFDEKLSKFEAGDAFGAYLMDEFYGGFEGYNGGAHSVNQGGIGERPNANLPVDYWKYQSNFQWMYNLVNYVNSNYKYTLNEELSAWENPGAQLVEGNYLLMFPQNEKITNRRELWFTINPEINLELVKPATQYHVGLENQVYLGYSQIYRNDKASDNGVFKIPANLHSVMSIAEIAVKNQSNTDFMIEKIVMRKADGTPIPTLAYVKPAAGPNRDGGLYELLEYTEDLLKGECEAVEGAALLKENCFDQEDARAITHWATTADGHIPYGLDEEAQVPVYEYTINFPENTVLKDNRQSDQKKSQTFAYISLPPSSPEFNYEDVEVVIYGKKWDSVINHGEGGYVDGMLTTQANTDNQIFTLDQLLTWNEGMDVPQVTCKFDDESFKQIETFAVKTTEELLTLVQGRLDDNTTTKNMSFEVTAYGNGLEVTQAVVDMINNYEKAHNVEINMTFKAKNGTPIILKDKDIFDRFDYRNVEVICAADQKISKKDRGGVNELLVEEGVTVEVKGVKFSRNVIDVHGTLVTDDATLDEVHVDGTMNVAGSTSVEDMYIDNDCVGCGKAAAVVNINKGTLSVDELGIGNGKIQINAPGVLSTYYAETSSSNCPVCGNTHVTSIVNKASYASKVSGKAGDGRWTERDAIEKALSDAQAKCAADKKAADAAHAKNVADELEEISTWTLEGDALANNRIGASQFSYNTGTAPEYAENQNKTIKIKEGSTITFYFSRRNNAQDVNVQLKITINQVETVYNISATQEDLTLTLDQETADILLDRGLDAFEVVSSNSNTRISRVIITVK